MELYARPDATGAWVVTLLGELDLAAVPGFRSATQEALGDGWIEMVIDLESVSFVDSAGLGALVGLRRRLNERDGSLVLRTNDHVVRTLTASGLGSLFGLVESRSET